MHPPALGKLHRITNQIDQYLAQAERIPTDRWRHVRQVMDTQVNVLLGGPQLQAVDDFIKQHPGRKQPLFRVQLASLDP